MLGFYVTNLLRRTGRTFIAGLAENETVDGLIIAGAIVQMLSYMDKFTDTLTPTGGSLKLCTYNTEPGSPYYETKSDYAGSYGADTVLAYQRRRKPFVGI
jgi:hypothetical protein